MNIYILLIVAGLVLAVLVIRWRTQEMNVPRPSRRRTQDVLQYEDMTPEERRLNGFIPRDDLPPDWQEFYKRGGKHGRR